MTGEIARLKKEQFQQRRQAASVNPLLRCLVAIHNELAQQHTRAANAAKNADNNTYIAAHRHIQRLLGELNAAVGAAKAGEQP